MSVRHSFTPLPVIFHRPRARLRGSVCQSVIHPFTMTIRPRECFNHFHLIVLAGLVGVSLTLVIVGASLSAWCIRYGNSFECHSLLSSERTFSCLFKLVPAGIIFSLIVSLFMFVILIIGQAHVEYSGVAKKEYQLVARVVNILALSIAIILIMIVFLQWFHPPAHSSKPILISMIPVKNEQNQTASKWERFRRITISPDDPSYLKVIGAERQSILDYQQRLNHGPHMFFAAFIIIFLTLLGFVIGHRLGN